MTLILRKCKSNGSSSYNPNFKYGQVGERVNAPDWKSDPECGNGLHGLKEGNGDWSLLDGDDWLVIDADDQIVNIDESKCKFNTGIILFRGTEEQLSKTDFCHKMATNSNSALNWAKSIGNHNIMINRITDSYSAYCWAVHFGNQNVMIDKISESKYAYLWTKFIGNKDIMINRITDSSHAYYWAREIGDEDIMIDRITDSQYAYWWAVDIGDRDIMKSKVIIQYWINVWNCTFPNDKIESKYDTNIKKML